MPTSNKPYNREQELKLIKMAQHDAKYFGILYDAHFRSIFKFVNGKVRDKDRSLDIAQQTFLKAWLNIKNYVDKGFPFSSWLYRIASNETNMFFRTKKIEVEVKEKDAFEMMNEIGDENGEKNLNLALDLVSKLPEDQNQLIELRFFDKLSFQEIGDILNITEASAKMRLKRILEKLKADLINSLKK